MVHREVIMKFRREGAAQEQCDLPSTTQGSTGVSARGLEEQPGSFVYR